MMNVASFRAALPSVFRNSVTYPDDAVAFWITVATMMLDPLRWGQGAAVAPVFPTPGLSTKLDLGIMLFVAHNLILEQQAGRAANRGGLPGLNTGAISSESVGPVSRGYDSAAGLELGAGHWNLTTYGTRFVRLADMVGMGPLTVGGRGCAGPYSGQAWAGPPVGIFPWVGQDGG